MARQQVFAKQHQSNRAPALVILACLVCALGLLMLARCLSAQMAGYPGAGVYAFIADRPEPMDTDTSTPTATSTPTYTPSPTVTPTFTTTPSETPTPTSTRTHTYTPSSTVTSTPTTTASPTPTRYPPVVTPGPVPLVVRLDHANRLCVENDYYRLEISKATSLIIKTGAGPREWRIFEDYSSGGRWIGGRYALPAETWPFWFLDGAPVLSVWLLVYRPNQYAVVEVWSTGPGEERASIVSTLTFRAGSPAIGVHAQVVGNTHPVAVEALIYHLFLAAGGDVTNDYFTWSGGAPAPFPYAGHRFLGSDDLQPTEADWVHLSLYDTHYRQGLALVARLSDTKDSPEGYRAAVEGQIYGWDPFIGLSMDATRATTFYLYPFTVNPADPAESVEAFIRVLAGLSEGGVFLPFISTSTVP